MLSFPLDQVFGLGGGMEKKSMMQMFHSIHDLERSFPRPLWEVISAIIYASWADGRRRDTQENA
jgi:hypothetical protein